MAVGPVVAQNVEWALDSVEVRIHSVELVNFDFGFLSLKPAELQLALLFGFQCFFLTFCRHSLLPQLLSSGLHPHCLAEYEYEALFAGTVEAD